MARIEGFKKEFDRNWSDIYEQDAARLKLTEAEVNAVASMRSLENLVRGEFKPGSLEDRAYSILCNAGPTKTGLGKYLKSITESLNKLKV